MAENGRIRVFAGNGNPELAQEICEILGLELSKCSIELRSGGEKEITIEESVRGDDVFIIQPTSAPISENLLELLMLIDAVRRASARSVTAVIPYFGYARFNRKKKPRDPITAKLLANMIAVAGANHVLVVDLHDKQVQSFFDIPCDHIKCECLFSEYIRTRIEGDIVVVSPDSQGVSRAREVASRLEAGLAIVYKKKGEDGTTSQAQFDVIGDVAGKIAVIVDDIIDTGLTASRAAAELNKRGAKDIYVVCTHAVLSRGAKALIEQAPIREVVTTNTVRIRRHKLNSKLTVLSAAPLIAESINRIHSELPFGSIPDSVLRMVKFEAL